LLYSEVNIPLTGKEYICFNHTILKQPELAVCVWGARLGGFPNSDSNGFFRTAETLLNMLPALRILELMNREYSDGFTSLFDKPMMHLRRASFSTLGATEPRISLIQPLEETQRADENVIGATDRTLTSSLERRNRESRIRNNAIAKHVGLATAPTPKPPVKRDRGPKNPC
jgi:hypothetical protein